MDWFSAFVGTLLIRMMVGGSTLLGMFYLWHGYYVFAAGLLVPLLGIATWLMVDLRDSGFDDVEWHR